MTDYYVSPTGNNKDNGRSPGTAWRAVQIGLDALSPGDTLYLLEGTYSPGDEGIDSWGVARKKGSASDPITVKNYDNGAVKLTGEEKGATGGFPQTGLKVFDSSRGSYSYKGVTYQTTYAALFDIDQSSYVTIEGIEIADSLGEAINISDSDHITISNCRTFNIRSRAMTFRDSKYLSLVSCELNFCNWGKMGGSGGPNSHNCEYIYIDNNIFTQLDGEGMVFDAACKHVYIRNNICFDISRGAIYVSGADYVIITGNYIFPTIEDMAAGPGGNRGSGGFNVGDGGKAISINARECDFTTLQKGSKYVLVAYNVIQNMDIGVQVKTEPGTASNCAPGYKRQPMEYIYLVNNTIVDATDVSFRFNTDTFKNCVFKNNVSVNNNPSRHLNSGEGNVTGVDSDNNFYSSAVSIPSNLTGPNDVVNQNPKLEGPDEKHKPEPIRQEDANGFYVSPGPWGKKLLDASGMKLTSTSPCIDAAQKVPAPSGWSEMNDYLVLSFDFSRSGTNPKRSGTWDIGADEFKTETSIKAAFSARPTNGVAPLTVSFKDTSESTSPITSRFWDFGDGVISTEKDPTHEYLQGQFTVSLRVTSSAGTDIATESDLISVSAPPEPLPERVTQDLSVLYRFNEGAGDTVYDVSGVGSPLDLKISDPTAVTWLSQGLDIHTATILVSNGPASKINDAIRTSNEVTVEVWIMPRQKYQDGPARIVSMSKNMHSRNMTLGHGLWGTLPSDLYDMRLRTTERSANGMPSFSTPAGTAEKRKTHLVFTRGRGGRARFIVDGTIVAETTIPGDFSTWNPRFPLLLGNETTGDYPWRGYIYLVAIYSRALTLDEVRQNFAAGTDPTSQTLISQPVALTTSFRRFILVRNGIENAVANGATKALAYGVEYPDKRCVLCANGNTSSMAVYTDVNAIVRTYGKQGLKIKWLD